jgi:hypothetical protein
MALAGTEVILIGGVAANVHGAIRTTRDLDVVYSRSSANIDRLVAALAPLHPYLRGAPPGLPFAWDARTIKMGLNFTLTTSAGEIDLLGEVTGGGSYEELLPSSEEIALFGSTYRCVTLPTLIQLKRASGRPKDFEAIAELELLLEERAKI